MNPASAPLFADELDCQSRPGAVGSFFATATTWPIAILGVPFDHVTVAQAIARIEAMIASRRPHYVATANIDFLVEGQRDGELRRLLVDADLVLCEGRPLVWASRWLGNGLPERIAGRDLVPELLRRAVQNGHRVFFLGDGSLRAEEARSGLLRHYPSLTLVGSYSPSGDDFAQDGEEISRRVQAANPDLLLVSIRCAKQEKWLAQHHRTLGVPVTVAVGGDMQVLTGCETRVPKWMQRFGLASIHRVLEERKRLYRRYAKNLACFFPMLIRQCGRLLTASHDSSAPTEHTFNPPEWCCIDVGTRLTRRTLEQQSTFWQKARDRATHCLVDVSKLDEIDGTGVAFLIRWRKQVAERGREFVLLAPSVAVEAMLNAMKLTDHFVVVRDLPAAIARAQSPGAKKTVQRDGTTRSLAWCGEIVNGNVDDVWRMTSDHITTFVAGQTTLVIIDLARLRFIDSAGAALMLRLKKWAQQQRTEILFAHPPPNVRNVLRLTQVEQLLLEGGQ